MPNTWVTNKIVNGYMNYLRERNKENCRRMGGNSKRCHIYSTFFKTHLMDLKEDVSRYSKRAVPDGDIFKLKLLIVPMNLNNLHWMCMSIDMRQKTITTFDSLADPDGKTEDRPDEAGALLEYLQAEHMRKHGTNLDDGWRIIGCPGGTPLQDNCEYAHCIDLIPRSIQIDLLSQLS